MIPIATETEKKPSAVEVVKRQSHHLRGAITEELANDSATFTEASRQLLKFHGVYPQDDRDLRRSLRQAGKEPRHIMMVRARIPGGILSAEQYLTCDDVTSRYGGGSLRITTRQTFQFHYVLKSNLQSTIRELNAALVTTLNGCGDQARNVISCAEPMTGSAYEELACDRAALVAAIGAKTNAYQEIWLDGQKIAEDAQETEEPLYGDVYLPRKFKFGFALAGDNCVDIYSNDIGLVAHVDDGHISGYTLLAGGGMGRSAGVKATYARLASPLGFIPRGDLVPAALAALTVFRDFGNRSDRRFARLKYLLDDRGLVWFRDEVASRLGRRLAAPRPLLWQRAEDHLGWNPQGDGHWYLGLFVENGRITDGHEGTLKSALRTIVERWRPEVHLTTQQNIILAGFLPKDRSAVETVLKAAGVRLPWEVSKTRRNAMACVGLPTCGLAVADSERALPQLLPAFEALFNDLDLGDDDISIRMTGCSNGCARPYISDIAFVGRSLGKYDVLLGGDFLGTRLNQIYQELVPMDQIYASVAPVIAAFAAERRDHERFGDFCVRVGLERLREMAVSPASGNPRP